MGCPQGSVLGPTLWNMLMDDLLRLPLPEGVAMTAYADDVTILIESGTRAGIESRARVTLDLVREWGLRNRLEFSSSKSTTMTVRGKLQPPPPPVIKLGGESIKTVTNVKVLGVVLDSGLSFVQHASDISERATKGFGKMSRVSTSSWGVRYPSLKLIHRGVFVSTLTYAAECWLTGCKYACIGCPWRGPAHEAGSHEAQCAHPAKSAADLMALLADRERQARDSTAVYEQIMDLLSYEKITFNDLQLRPYRTEEFVHKLYYETSRFSAFGHQWVVKAYVNKNQRDPTQSAQREITYQLILKSKTSAPLSVQWVCTRGPWGEVRFAARVAAHSFRDDATDAPPLPLPLAEPRDANRLLATKPLHCRLIMFLSSK
ncbi:unnamed protein product [Parnassius mnemosyne]|uniref:Reverse transcriptase domain-containing protein n=1 Tax=Parnassius mnemosyne TaxID=213953 RepID=A0AAV1KR76_9NEOP